ncbi:hypothetical protein L6164_029228 [Bauhinia variegata]|uniref:Uncharacterized protein n=1 Tax=Bauhinia variegata TaxID=167791 RepID=A0ACB9L8G6_BAUVA|nr:hypothetical protein L6164_029228 [Bauhinia variegata]
MYKNKKHGGKHESSKGHTDMRDDDMDIRKIMKEVENFGTSHMTWKERKEIENKNVVSLGGKPVKKQRLPLSVARPMMKKQKEREQKMLQERLILGRFEGKLCGSSSSSSKRPAGKHKAEHRGLKSSEGTFRNGVLDVRRLLNSAPSRAHDSGSHVSSTGKKEGSKKKQGKKTGGRKRH